MSNLAQIPTDYKRYLDETLHQYLPKKNKVRDVFDQIQGDSGDVELEYAKLTQTYTAAKGWTSFADPEILADGARPQLDSLGTEDATSVPVPYAKGFRIDRRMNTSNKSIIRQYVMKHAMKMADIMENWVNRTLITNMLSNAAQSYSASDVWSDTGDSVGDLIAAKNAFYDASGTMEADFCILNTNEMTDLQKDQRFQSTDYTSNKPVDTGTFTPRPLGLDFIIDPAMTTGSFLLGKKAEFGRLFITENYKTVEETDGLAGTVMEGVFTFVDQYHLPYLLMAGTGI